MSGGNLNFGGFIVETGIETSLRIVENMNFMESYLNKEFFEWVEQVAERLKEYEMSEIVVVHHNDADGITSGAILSHLCECLDRETERICIEKVYPEVIKKIHEGREGQIIVYTDLAGLAAEAIDKIDAGRNTVYIIDHHPARAIESENVFVLDPELAGISGDTFISASTLCYLVSRAMTEEMNKFAYLAVVGAVGDYHDRSGGILGIDRYALHEAIHEKQAKIMIEGHRERYYIPFFGEYADVIAKRLTNLGVVGYEVGAYRKGIEACINGFDEKTIEEAENYEELKTAKFHEAIEYLKEGGGLRLEKHTQWFHLEDMFSPMGVKAVGEFCQQIKDMTFIDENRYLIGFQNIPKEIPDLGVIELDASKMSGRVPQILERKILSGDSPGFDYLVPKASEIIGAFADATHRIAAATVVKKGTEKEFIKVFERLVESA